MAKLDIYRYHFTQADGTDIIIELTEQQAWNLALEIKRDVDEYGVWRHDD